MGRSGYHPRVWEVEPVDCRWVGSPLAPSNQALFLAHLCSALRYSAIVAMASTAGKAGSDTLRAVTDACKNKEWSKAIRIMTSLPETANSPVLLWYHTSSPAPSLRVTPLTPRFSIAIALESLVPGAFWCFVDASSRKPG